MLPLHGIQKGLFEKYKFLIFRPWCWTRFLPQTGLYRGLLSKSCSHGGKTIPEWEEDIRSKQLTQDAGPDSKPLNQSQTKGSTPFWPYRPTDTIRYLHLSHPLIDTLIHQEEDTEEEENFAPFPIKTGMNFKWKTKQGLKGQKNQNYPAESRLADSLSNRHM